MVSRAHWAALALLGVYVLSTFYIIIRLVVPLPFLFFLLPLSTLAFFAFALMHAGLTLGWPRAALFLAVTFLISFVLESVGVATGLVYGAYSYTDRLGPKLLGLVPVYVPLAWFMMGYTAYALVARLAVALNLRPGWRANVWVATVGALAMTAWDLTMDPLMVSGGHWVWHAPGDYFGIPPSNYAGWMVTTFSIYMAYLALEPRVQAPLPQVPTPWWASLPLVVYTLAGLSNFTALLIRGMPGPVVAGFFGMAPFVLVGLVLWSRPVEVAWGPRAQLSRAQDVGELGRGSPRRRVSTAG